MFQDRHHTFITLWQSALNALFTSTATYQIKWYKSSKMYWICPPCLMPHLATIFRKIQDYFTPFTAVHNDDRVACSGKMARSSSYSLLSRPADLFILSAMGGLGSATNHTGWLIWAFRCGAHSYMRRDSSLHSIQEVSAHFSSPAGSHFGAIFHLWSKTGPMWLPAELRTKI